MIKPCDKGAGIIILDFVEYMQAATEHLEARTKTGEKYYQKVNENKLKEATNKITKKSMTMIYYPRRNTVQCYLQRKNCQFLDNFIAHLKCTRSMSTERHPPLEE